MIQCMQSRHVWLVAMTIRWSNAAAAATGFVDMKKMYVYHRLVHLLESMIVNYAFTHISGRENKMYHLFTSFFHIQHFSIWISNEKIYDRKPLVNFYGHVMTTWWIFKTVHFVLFFFRVRQKSIFLENANWMKFLWFEAMAWYRLYVVNLRFDHPFVRISGYFFHFIVSAISEMYISFQFELKYTEQFRWIINFTNEIIFFLLKILKLI